MNDFEKLKTEFITKRCEQIIRNIEVDNEKSRFNSFIETLNKEQRDNFLNYVDELNYINSIYEEKIYMAGFRDALNIFRDEGSLC